MGGLHLHILLCCWPHFTALVVFNCQWASVTHLLLTSSLQVLKNTIGSLKLHKVQLWINSAVKTWCKLSPWNPFLILKGRCLGLGPSSLTLPQERHPSGIGRKLKTVDWMFCYCCQFTLLSTVLWLLIKGGWRLRLAPDPSWSFSSSSTIFSNFPYRLSAFSGFALMVLRNFSIRWISSSPKPPCSPDGPSKSTAKLVKYDHGSLKCDSRNVALTRNID